MKPLLRAAMLYDKLPGSYVQCHVCQWRCKIAPGKLGVCQVRRNQGGEIELLNYALVSSATADPIEKKPLFHFQPGTLCYSLGGWGCNFHCQHCQNWQISCTAPGESLRASWQVSPDEAVLQAKRHHCQGIAWTYNEPSIWLEYTLDSARLARATGLYTVYVTNGYATEEGLDTIGPYLDAYRVDIKGFSDHFYKELSRVSRWRGILDVAARAKHKWHMHVEVVTNVIPTMNDSAVELEALANWIRDQLGDRTPWHVTRFYPHYHMMDLPATPVATLEQAYAIGRKAGLKFVYLGNVPGHDGENTYCYNCGRLVIRRMAYDAELVGLSGSRCRYCAAELNVVTGEGPADARGVAL